MSGTFDYDAAVEVTQILLLGASSAPSSVTLGGESYTVSYDSASQVASVNVTIPLTGDASVSFGQVGQYTGAGSVGWSWSWSAIVLAAVGMMVIVLL